jgi:hypothetical protein
VGPASPPRWARHGGIHQHEADSVMRKRSWCSCSPTTTRAAPPAPRAATASSKKSARAGSLPRCALRRPVGSFPATLSRRPSIRDPNQVRAVLRLRAGLPEILSVGFWTSPNAAPTPGDPLYIKGICEVSAQLRGQCVKGLPRGAMMPVYQINDVRESIHTKDKQSWCRSRGRAGGFGNNISASSRSPYHRADVTRPF